MKNKLKPWLDVLGNTLDKNDFILNYDEYCKYLYFYMDFNNIINKLQGEFFLYKYKLGFEDVNLEFVWDNYTEDYIDFIEFIKTNKERFFLKNYSVDSIDFFYGDDRDFIFMEKKISSLSNCGYMYSFPSSYGEKDIFEFVNSYSPSLISKTKTIYVDYLRVFNSMICLFNNSFVIISDDLGFIAFIKKNHFIISFTRIS